MPNLLPQQLPDEEEKFSMAPFADRFSEKDLLAWPEHTADSFSHEIMSSRRYRIARAILRSSREEHGRGAYPRRKRQSRAVRQILAANPFLSVNYLRAAFGSLPPNLFLTAVQTAVEAAIDTARLAVSPGQGQTADVAIGRPIATAISGLVNIVKNVLIRPLVRMHQIGTDAQILDAYMDAWQSVKDRFNLLLSRFQGEEKQQVVQSAVNALSQSSLPPQAKEVLVRDLKLAA